MVDTKFLIVTTLCYVGILIVVLAVCCCAWARYMKNEGKMPPNRRTKPTNRGSRRALVREPSEHCPPPPPTRQYRYIGDFTDLNYPHQPINYPHVQHGYRSESRPSYSSNVTSNHYTLGYPTPPRNFYPASLVTATDTYDMDIRMDIGSAAYGDTSHGGFSGDEFSDFQSSRYDSGHDVSGIISGDGAVLSCSDVANSLKIANNNSIDNELTNECRTPSTDVLEHDDYTREITVEVTESVQSYSDYPAAGESLLVTSMTEECCNGVDFTPSPSTQSLAEFNDQPEIPLNTNEIVEGTTTT